MIKYELIERSLLYIYKDLILPDVYDVLEECEELLDDGFFAIGAYESSTNETVGAVVFDQGMDEVLSLISIYVDESHRREKIGKTLIQTAFSVTSENEALKEPDERLKQNTFVCNFRMEEEPFQEFFDFLTALGVEDFINLPEGVVFPAAKMMDSPLLKAAVYDPYTMPEYTYRLDDLEIELNVNIRENSSWDAFGQYSFAATDKDSNLYCSVIEKINNNYYRLHLLLEGDDISAMLRAFEGSVNALFTYEDMSNALMDTTFINPPAREFFDSLKIDDYKTMHNTQAAMVVEFINDDKSV